MEINNREMTGNSLNNGGKNPNQFPSNLWVKEEVAKKFKSKYI